MNDKIATNLRNDLEAGEIVLFLGAGAIFGSTIGVDNNPALLGDTLRDKLQSQFFPTEGPTKSSLKRVCSSIQSIQGKDALRQALIDLLIPVNPSSALRSLPKFSWSAIYTVNIDDAIESVYESAPHRTQKLMPVVLPGDKAARDKTTEVSYYKLHGCLRHPESNLIFSHRDYTESRETNLKMFVSLTSDLCDLPFLFVGFSLEDDDFQAVWESVLNYLGSRKRSRSTYLISPNAPKSTVEALEIEGIDVLDQSVGAFFPWLAANRKKRAPSLEERVRHRVAPIQQLIQKEFGTKIDNDLVDKINQNFDFVRQLPETLRDPSLSRFFKGVQPSWDDIKNGLPITRDIEADVTEQISIWQGKGFKMALVTAGAGYGKTTFLMQIASAVARWPGKMEVLFLKSYGDFNCASFTEYSQALGVPILLIVDDIYKHINSLRRLKADAEANHLPVFLLGATRPSDWNTAKKTGAFDIQNRIDLPRLTEDEARDLAKAMKRTGSLAATFQNMSLDELAKHYLIASEQHLLAGLLTSVSEENEGFAEIIKEEYFRINDQHAKEIYLSVALVHSLGLPTPASLACQVINCNLTDYHREYTPILDTTILESVDCHTHDLMFETQHRVIAETLIHSIIRPADAVSHIIALATCINPHQTEQYRILLRLYHEDYLSSLLDNAGTIRSCYEQLLISFPTDPYIKQHFAIFETHQQNFAKAKELIGGAIAEAGRHAHFVNTEANILLREAVQEPDRDRAESLFQAGAKRLRERIEKDADKEIHILSLVERQIDWAKRVDLTKEQRLSVLEDAEADLANAKRRYPSSSETAATAGKLQYQLNRIPDAKILLQRSIVLDGSNSWARVLLARIMLQDHEFEPAEVLIKEGLTYAPDHFGLLRLRLDCAKKLNRPWPELRNALIGYLKIAENDFHERIEIVKGYIEASDFAAAKKHLEKLKRIEAPFNQRKKTLLPLMKEGKPMIAKGEFISNGIGRGFMSIHGFPDSMRAFLDLRSLSSGSRFTNGATLQVEIGINGLGIVVIRTL